VWSLREWVTFPTVQSLSHKGNIGGSSDVEVV
jgi:hypothetical protein